MYFCIKIDTIILYTWMNAISIEFLNSVFILKMREEKKSLFKNISSRSDSAIVAPNKITFNLLYLYINILY